MAFKTTIVGREALQRRLDELVPEASKAAAVAKLEVAREAANRIASRAPIGATGVLKDSIIGARQADMPGAKAIGSNQSKDPDATGVYADFTWKFVEHGTAPHKIMAKNKPALVFRGKGGGPLIVAEEVNHPGSRAQPFVFYTWKAYRKAAKAKIARAISKAVKAASGK
ncbi:HK97 gp10 family phage protein [Mesorhizobium sp. B2-4-8]|uniref:HK97 gp10 family phage protein n=1 Tax=Mesorhizobium sp. B2-4-8 TaxID=2589941 RepID=UPI00112DBEAD|nr:HK97 gp10 family phage protein [Mesorhizobium sp. B2-4-8]TPL36743.1 HK97 gp10 family phage protein [Mesorhizobium sp. B2-4-8]